MRTTVTLDPDVEITLRRVMKDRGVTFKEALNDAIRKGTRSAERHTRRRTVLKSHSMGSEQLFPWNKALQFSSQLEDEEILRKLALRK